ncbi:tetratricopeptide repeat protein [Alkalimarinus alittae]|uniref:Tetratricopeptide repeat protein n=1 Tax=Alkalimarinus alittae TaxID=2961619 RepID=A0ABY6N7D9_9ALTE|nr:tetratricopeptide repeat protein [Alkalimarinus alittae]UZE98022.1 tetratricopeptide repeat protein [Alkalimarinus alittae]
MPSLLRWSLVGILTVVSGVALGAAKNSFQIDFDAEPEVIGDIKPAFLNFDQEPLPAVPIKEIIRRYRQLFNDTSVPEVRIDVLHRLTNLEAIYGDPKERSLEEERELYKKALDSYEMIVGTGVYSNRIDELLYQTAKAYDFTGQHEKSLKSLEQLVGLYPNSYLAVEAQFRVGEAHFSLGQYKKAEKAYKKSLVNSEDSKFYDNALFMMGWSQFKQNKYDESGKTFIGVLDRLNKHAVEQKTNLLKLDGIQGETARDTLRALSITFSYEKGASGVDALLDQVGNKPYGYLLYLQLAERYLSQQRYEDSASAARAYINRFGGDSKSPMMHHSIINAYTKGGFPIKVWDEKETFVSNYSPAYVVSGRGSASQSSLSLNARAVTAENRVEVAQWLRQYLQELSHYYYVSAQKKTGTSNKAAIHSKVKNSHESDALYRKAGEYYRLLVAAFPADENVGEYSFLAAESFYKSNDLNMAIVDYEYSAYKSGSHSYALEAGYAAILTHNELKKNGRGEERHRLGSINLFTTHFPADKRVPAVLNDLANEHLSAGRYIEARDSSRAVIEHPLATKALKRSSWLVNGHSNFELIDYASAEHAYAMAIELLGNDTSTLSAVNERMAASIYRQGEIAVSSGDRQGGIDQFLRLGRIVPASALVANAQYDAAVQMLELKQWRKAIVVLARFQKDYPKNALAEDIPDKLIYAHLESGNKLEAANQLIALSKRHPNTEKSRKALYQAADLYSSAGVKNKSILLLTQYVNKYPKPFDLYIEGLQTISQYYGEAGELKKRDEWLQKIVKADAGAGSDRNTRSKFLAASASMQLVQESLDEFQAAKLNLPLKKSLKKKSALLKKAVDQLQTIPKYGVAQLTTEATFKLGEVYRQLGKDIMVSERPSTLNELQLEQYEILLEEQAYPFEEKSIEVHEINISRTKGGIYDNWVKESYQILGTIVPARYLRGEKSVGLDRNIQ